jgi:uncharacterized protein YndB with AHSA1/START domain
VKESFRFRIDGIVSAPIERVFALISQPEQIARWWGPHGFRTPEIELDLRTGGRYRFTMQPPEGDAFHLQGEFVEVDPPRKLSYTFRWEEPTTDDTETVAELTLGELGERTRLEIEQGAFKTEERRELHRNGWGDGLEKLQSLAAG